MHGEQSQEPKHKKINTINDLDLVTQMEEFLLMGLRLEEGLKLLNLRKDLTIAFGIKLIKQNSMI